MATIREAAKKVAKERDAAGCRRVKSGERRPGERAMRAEEGRVGDSPHKHLECDTLVSSTHIKAVGCGVRRPPISRRPTSAPLVMAATTERRLFVALFDFPFTEIAFTYAPRTEIKQIRKCLRRPPAGHPMPVATLSS